MTDPDTLVDCRACGTQLARRDMFGVEPDLLCPRCASGVRRRMQVRVRHIRPDRKPIVTLTMLGIAALLYVLDKFVYPNPTLRAENWPDWWSAVYLNLHAGPRIWDGDVWTMLGAAFFHGNFIHILFNCWWIWELGKATENGFGSLALAGVVIGGATVATGAEWVANGPGVGLSGVVYALAFFLWAHHKTNPHAASMMNQRTINFLGMWFVLCIVLTMTGTWRIANWAHGAGGLWGWGVGLAMVHAQRKILVPLAVAATIALIAAFPMLTFGHQTTLRKEDQRIKARGYDHRARLVHWFNERGRMLESGE